MRSRIAEFRTLMLAAVLGVMLVAAAAAGVSRLLDLPVGISAEPVSSGDRLTNTARDSAPGTAPAGDRDGASSPVPPVRRGDHGRVEEDDDHGSVAEPGDDHGAERPDDD